MSQKQSQQEKSLVRQIIEGQQRINEIFRDMELKTSQVIKASQSNQQSPNSMHVGNANPVNQHQGYLSKYNQFSIQKIRQNYDNAFYLLKWYQLPFCRNIVQKKIQFFIPASSILALAYTMHRMSKQNMQKFSFKIFGRSYLAFAVGTSIFAVVESMLFEPHCDINSHHYNRKFSGLELARKLKSTLTYQSQRSMMNHEMILYGIQNLV